ncbi:MAG: hypothetical protein ACO3EK_16200, partial [Alphaproteobacteria bacterium]
MLRAPPGAREPGPSEETMRTVRSAPITRRKLATFAGATAGLAMAPSILKAQAINLRYANASNEQALTNQFAAAFAKALKERSNGAIDIQLVLNAGSEQSIVESVALGSIDMALSGYSGLAEFDVLGEKHVVVRWVG